MNRLESELLDLEELLMRNDGMADDGTYSTIVGIANDVSKLEEENGNLRELVRDMDTCISHGAGIDCGACPLDGREECYFDLRMSRLGIEVTP